MNSFRKAFRVFVLAAAVAVIGTSAFAPKATSALLPVEHDRSGMVYEHGDRSAVIIEHGDRSAVIIEHGDRTAVIIEHDRNNA